MKLFQKPLYNNNHLIIVMKKLLWLIPIAILALLIIAYVVYAAAATLTITLISPTPANNGYTVGSFVPNISTINNATNCTLYFNGTTLTHTTIANVGDLNISFTNETEITFTENAFSDSWQNMTVMCFNTSVKYWLNTSATVGWFNFKIDNTAPVITTQVATIYNNTGYGNKLRLRFNVTDNNVKVSWLRIYYPDKTLIEKNVTNITTSPASAAGHRYEYNVTYADLTQDGIYFFEPKSIDEAGNSASGSNWTFVAMNLKASKWNPTTFFQNLTLAQIGSLSENITYVSIYHNNASKTFITFQNGLSTNGAIALMESLNTTIIYPTVNITIIYSANVSVSRYPNTIKEINTGGWNFVSTINATTLNATLYSVGRCGNLSYPTTVNESHTFTGNGTANATLLTTYPRIISITSVGNSSVALTSTNYTFNATHIWFLQTGPVNDYSTYNVTNVAYNVTFIGTYDLIMANTCDNTTYVSWYNPALNQFCTLKRGWNITSCSGIYGSTVISSLTTSGLWLLTTQNMSLNRSVNVI